MNVFFFQTAKMSFFFFRLKLFRGVKTGAEKKRGKKKKMTAEKTEIYKHTPHRVCATVFHRRHFVNAPLSDLNSLYIETVCANAGSQTRCCTTLYVARCFIVLSCAVCNKDKVSATLWRLKWIIEVWRCDVLCLLTGLSLSLWLIKSDKLKSDSESTDLRSSDDGLN